MPLPRDEIDRINEMSADAVKDYLRRSSITYLEACMSLMLTCMSAKEVARVLADEAAMLEELG